MTHSTHSTHSLSSTLRLAVLCGALAAFPLAAQAAGDVAGEITTAATHAGFAAKSGTIAMVHAHMHHALNCLVGPKGDGFDATALDPCKNSGTGAIPDTMDTATKTKLEAAAAELRSGLKDDTLKTAQATASKVEGELKAIK